jgi:methanogenic corrinoid protein MtbC1
MVRLSRLPGRHDLLQFISGNRRIFSGKIQRVPWNPPVSHAGTEQEGGTMTIFDSLLDCIRRADRDQAKALLDAWGTEHGYERLLTEVLEPTLVLIGEQWRSFENFSLAQAYMAAKITEDMLLKIAERTAWHAGGIPPKGPVVIGNIEEDFHALGRKMLGTFLGAEGWLVHDLGNDVPPEVFVDKAEEVGARVIGVSAMMLTTARNIRRVREEVDRRGLTGRLQLAVGGAVFLVMPGLVDDVGGDGTAANAIEAVQLFDRLWADSMVGEGQP